MTLMLTTFFSVFLLVFQQQNVQHRRFVLSAVTSIAITISQFVLIQTVMSSEHIGMIYMGFGGVCGVLLSMYIHPKLIALYTRRTL